MSDMGMPDIYFGQRNGYDAENQKFHLLRIFRAGKRECKFQTAAFSVPDINPAAVEHYGILYD